MASTFVCPLNNKCITNIIILFFNFKNIIKIMDKKELKFYEAPACEVVELNVVSFLMTSNNSEGVNDEDITEDDMKLDD